jgi:hypothetical protein
MLTPHPADSSQIGQIKADPILFLMRERKTESIRPFHGNHFGQDGNPFAFTGRRKIFIALPSCRPKATLF